jgi:protein TonB
MRSALCFILSVGLHAAALAYPVTFAWRGHSQILRVTVLPDEPGGGGGSGNSAPKGKPKPTFTAPPATPLPRVEAKTANTARQAQIAAAAEIEIVSASSAALISEFGVPSDSKMDFAAAKPIDLAGDPGGEGSGVNGNGLATGFGSGVGSGSGPGPDGSGSGASLIQARYRDTPQPEYPESARRQGREGRVLLRVLIDDQGRSKEVEINRSSGSDVLDRAAAEAIKGWRFYPARHGEKAIASWIRIPIEFRLASSRR